MLSISTKKAVLAQSQKIPTGVWVTVFSEEKILTSKEAALRLINFCSKRNIDEIYLQLYRAGKPYYESKNNTVNFILKEAKKNNIKVFAWINTLSVGKNKEADIIKKYGRSVLTRDQYLRSSAKNDKPNETDKYYLRDPQLFLEPGDSRVQDYILSIIDEVISKYPALDGIHLDYIRYPNTVPYIPDSRFTKYGLSYGYGERNITAFKKETGIDPKELNGEKFNSLLWDNWKRSNVTKLVEKVSKLLKEKAPNLLLSCAVFPSPERAYSLSMQDWPLWLELGIVDYVALMNYTIDNEFAKRVAQSALSQRGQGRVYIGIGAFILKEKPELFSEQYKDMLKLSPDGIVFFSYDDIKTENIIPYLLTNKEVTKE